MGLRSKGEPSDALWFGIGWHLVMAHHYSGPGLKRGKKPLKVWEKYVDDQVRYVRTIPWEGAQYHEEKYVEAGKLGKAMLENYFNTYGDDDDCYMIAPEQTFQVLVPLFGPNGKASGHVQYVGTFDGVYRNGNGELWLWEHKTAKAIRTGHLPMDDQAGGYWAVASRTLVEQGLIGKRERLSGIMYNFVRKASPEDPRPQNADGLYTNLPKKEHFVAALAKRGIHNPERTGVARLKEECDQLGITVLGEVSANQPPPFFLREAVVRTPQERNTQLRRVGSEATVMNAYRNGLLPLIKNPTIDCEWDCQFFQMCQIHEQYPTDVNDYMQLAYNQQDPYADHRKSASGSD